MLLCCLQAVHGRFYLSDVPVAVGLVGPGLIGSTLLQQIKQQVWLPDDHALPRCTAPVSDDAPEPAAAKS